MAKFAKLMRPDIDESDYVTSHRVLALMVIDFAVIILSILVIANSYLFRTAPFMIPTLAIALIILAGAFISLILLRYVSYLVAAHTTVALLIGSAWLLNIWYAYEVTIKTETVYLFAALLLPAMLLERIWILIYGAGTLLIVTYITIVLANTGLVERANISDFAVDTGMSVIFVTIITYTLAGIYNQALYSVKKSLETQQKTNLELVNMAQAVEQSESQKRQFYRDTIYSITQGKLHICDEREIAQFIFDPEVSLNLPDESAASPVRHQIKDYLQSKGLSDEMQDSMEIAVGEAITNAVKHAGGGKVLAGEKDDNIWIAVLDKGKGIESLILPQAVLLQGYSTKPSLGLGYSMLLNIADHVLLKTSETGTTVVIVKSLRPAPTKISIESLPDVW